MRKHLIIAIVGMLWILASACGDTDDDAAPSAGADASTTTTTVPDGDATIAVRSTALGDVVTDAAGRTLYLFTKDTEAKSACSVQCAQTWPPLVVNGEPEAADGLDGARVATITRDDGSRQVSYGGHPLYRYAADQASGDTKGHGVGGVWFAVSPGGDAVASDKSGAYGRTTSAVLREAV